MKARPLALALAPLALAAGSFGISGSATAAPARPNASTHAGSHAPKLGTIFTADPNSHRGVFSFAPKSSGDVKPATHITGSKTAFYEPTTVSTARDGSVWVGGIRGPVVRFAPGATGNVKPLQSIAGPKTHIFEPTGIAVAADGSIWVADESFHSLLHFGKHANGNVAPKQEITGTTTGIDIPRALALTPDGKSIWEIDNGSLREFSTKDNGDVAPENVISGSNTLLAGSEPGVYVAVDGSIWAAVSNALLHFSAIANGNATPEIVEGAATGIEDPSEISHDAAGDLWVGSINNQSIVELPGTASGNTPYIRDITGPSTHLKGPWGTAVYGYRAGKVRQLTAAVRHGKAHVSWQAPKHTGGGVMFYRVQRRLGHGPWETIADPKVTHYTDGSPSLSTTRQYRAMAVNGYGYGAYSASAPIHTS